MIESQTTLNETTQLDQVTAWWQGVRDLLEHKKAQVNEAIVNYPPPIPACDQHFNYLLEERAKLPQELQRLADFAKQGTGQKEHRTLLEEFIMTSSHLNDEERQRVRAEIKADGF